MLQQVDQPGIDQGVRGVSRDPGEIAQVMLGEGITGRARHRQHAEALLVGEQRNRDEGSGLMLRVGRFEAWVGPRVPHQDRFPMRQRPSGDPLTDLEAAHFADRDRAVASGLDLEFLLELVDQGQRAALETDQLGGCVQHPIESEAPLDRCGEPLSRFDGGLGRLQRRLGLRQLCPGHVPASRQRVEFQLQVMLGRLRFQRALEVGPHFSAAALQRLDLGLEAADARLDRFLLHLSRGDLGVPGSDRCMRGRQLSGKPIALRRRVRPAARQVGEAGTEVLSLAIERLVGRLQGGVLVVDLLKLLDPCHMLAGDRSVFRQFGFQRRGSSPVAAELLLGLLEQLLVALQDTPLLAVRLQKLIQVLAQAGLNCDRIVERQVPGPGFLRKVGRPPRRPGGRCGGGCWALDGKRL